MGQAFYCFFSLRSLYSGGGYVADLGYTNRSAMRAIHNLRENNWIDERTRAVFIEVMIFEPTNSLFSAITYLFEVPPTGHGITSSKIKTMSLYGLRASGFQSFHAICELIVIIMLIYFLVVQTIKIYRMRCEYFKSAWNWVELAQLLVATATLVLSVFRRYHTSKLVEKIHENPFKTWSFHYTVLWSDLENILMAILVFIITVKILWILKFNEHICSLASSMKNCGRKIASFAAVYFVAFLAFAQLAILSFGSSVSFLSSVTEVFRTQFALFIGGDIDYSELVAANRILGPIYLFSFMTIMATIIINMFMAILNESYREVRIYSELVSDEHKTLDVFLDYAKKRLGDKLKKLRGIKMFPKSNKYVVKRANTKMGTQPGETFTQFHWPEPRTDVTGKTDEEAEERTVLKEVKRCLTSIRFEVCALSRSRKYKVHKFKLKSNERSLCEAITFRAKSKSTSFLNLSEDIFCRGQRERQSTRRLLSEGEESSDTDVEWDTSSYTESMNTLLGNSYNEEYEY